MSEPGEQAQISELVKALVKRLPRTSVLLLVEELDRGLQGDPRKIQLVRRALVQHLNSKRVQHVRRLFTNLLQPFLVDDLPLLAASAALPGMLHRHDVGGIWAALSLQVFPDLVLQAHQMLRDLVREQPVDVVLALPQVVSLQDRMRLEAVRGLDAVLAKKPKLVEFLDVIHTERRKDMTTRFGQLKVYPIEQASVQALRDILAAHPILLEEMDRVLPKRKRGDSAPHDEELGSALLEGFRRTRQRLLDGGLDATLAGLLPVQVLHVARNYAGIRQFVRRASQTENLTALYEAMHAHLAVRAEAIPRDLNLAMGVNRGWSGPLDLVREDQVALGDHLAHMQALLETFSALGLLHEPRIGQMISNTLDRMSRHMHDPIAPVVVDRACKAAQERMAPVEDHTTVVWALRFVWGWSLLLKRHLDWVMKIDPLRERMLLEMEDAFRTATQRQPTDGAAGANTPSLRWSHVCRIDQLMRCVDADIGAFVGAANRGLVAVVTRRLNQPQPMTPAECRLAAIVVDRARAELEKIRYWKDSDLVGLVEVADRIGLARLEDLPSLPPEGET
jgi:hypothetical protein